MSDIKTVLIQKFGYDNVQDFSYSNDDYIKLLKIDVIVNRLSYKLIMTNGLSDYEMPVPEANQGREFNEIYFCLPNYWDITDKTNPQFNWPFEIIQKLAKNVIENKTWYGPGHTISNGNPPKSASETMKQSTFLLATPILLEDYLQDIKIEDKEVYFMPIIPIFDNELAYKQSNGYVKWIRKFRMKNGTEVLDDYRTTVQKKRWGLF